LPSLALDEAGLRHNVRRYIELGLAGVFCNGLMGEVWSLSIAERQRILEVLIDEAQGRLGVSVVISGRTVEETLALGAHARRTGAAHAVLMLQMTEMRTDEEQLAYLQHICERLEMRVVLFNAATTAGPVLSPELFSRLCDLPGVTILKTTATPDHNDALRHAARNNVVVSDPLEEHFLINHRDHGQPILYADPEPYLYQTPDDLNVSRYIANLDAGQYQLAEQQFLSLQSLRAAYNKWIMEPLERGQMPNAALKHWCDMIGLAGGPARHPVLGLSDDQKREMEAELRQCGAPGVRA
jgi:4-hydroxy-tetrahydrodipicolinate synthase